MLLSCLGLFWALAVATTSASGSASGASWDRPDFATSTLSLDRGDGSLLTYRVELATTPRQQAYGLMHVEAMDADAGMLFIFDDMAVRSFWMKNTLIPLDMLFFDETGALVTAIPGVPALSLTPRFSTAGAKYVLELNAGIAAETGIGQGARLQLPVSGVE